MFKGMAALSRDGRTQFHCLWCPRQSHEYIPEPCRWTRNHSQSQVLLYLWLRGWAGSIDRCLSDEMIKLRLQFQRDKTELIPRTLHHHHKTKNQSVIYSGPWDALKKIYKREGLLRGMGRGYWVTCVRDVPAFATYFGTYDFLCRSAMRWKGVEHIDQLNPVTICIAGGAGGVISWLTTYPVDVVKSRFQIDGMDPNTGARYKSSTDCFVQSTRSGEGWRGFFVGLSPTHTGISSQCRDLCHSGTHPPRVASVQIQIRHFPEMSVGR